MTLTPHKKIFKATALSATVLAAALALPAAGAAVAEPLSTSVDFGHTVDFGNGRILTGSKSASIPVMFSCKKDRVYTLELTLLQPSTENAGQGSSTGTCTGETQEAAVVVQTDKWFVKNTAQGALTLSTTDSIFKTVLTKYIELR